MSEPFTSGDGGGERWPAVRAEGSTTVARDLGGDLPCASCRYNLKGLSVLSVCPECGVPVRATILAAVDPYADVLRPIRRPRITAMGLVAWSLGALVAALLTWVQRLGDVVETLSDQRVVMETAARAGTGFLAVSALGALVLIRPHAGIPARRVARAAMGVACLAAAAGMYWRVHGVFDASHIRPYFAGDALLTERTWMRLTMGALMAGAVLLLRPNARLLAERSLLMRMGYVDRQTLRAMTLALGVAAAGDLAHLAAASLPANLTAIVGPLGSIMIAVGSMLFTAGLVGVAIDCGRIAGVVVRKPLSIGRVMGGAA